MEEEKVVNININLATPKVGLLLVLIFHVFLFFNDSIYSRLYVDKPNDKIYVKAEFPLQKEVTLTKVSDVDYVKFRLPRIGRANYYYPVIVTKDGSQKSLEQYNAHYFKSNANKFADELSATIKDDTKHNIVFWLFNYRILVLNIALVVIELILLGIIFRQKKILP